VDRRIELELNDVRRRLIRDRAELLRERMGDLALREAMELDMELRREGESIRKELEDLDQRDRLLQAEIRLQEVALRDAPIPAEDPDCLPHLVYAPVEGTVHAIHYEAYSVVNAGDVILSLKPLDPEVRVLAYAEPRVLSSLFPQKRVSVRFPDGSRQEGVVEGVHAAAELFPRLVVEEYRLLDSELLLEVRPSRLEDEEHWRRFDRLAVQVTGRRRER
jgi:hypothetical protein